MIDKFSDRNKKQIRIIRKALNKYFGKSPRISIQWLRDTRGMIITGEIDISKYKKYQRKIKDFQNHVGKYEVIITHDSAVNKLLNKTNSLLVDLDWWKGMKRIDWNKLKV